jgi:predicted Fe-Mo cluster-binding NifX family protein
MKIAVASQNRKAITGHAGKCRRFWIYEIENSAVKDKTLLELPRDQSFHAYQGSAPHPLQGVAILITGGMGEGLVRRLAIMGVEAIVTPETDPDQAIAAWLQGTLERGQREDHASHGAH